VHPTIRNTIISPFFLLLSDDKRINGKGREKCKPDKRRIKNTPKLKKKKRKTK